MAEQIDPDAETTEGTNKPFGEHVKDAAHDLKEDLKGVGRRNKDDEEGDGTSDEDGTPDEDGGGEDEA
jgi:hypothetical protein